MYQHWPALSLNCCSACSGCVPVVLSKELRPHCMVNPSAVHAHPCNPWPPVVSRHQADVVRKSLSGCDWNWHVAPGFLMYVAGAWGPEATGDAAMIRWTSDTSHGNCSTMVWIRTRSLPGWVLVLAASWGLRPVAVQWQRRALSDTGNGSWARARRL